MSDDADNFAVPEYCPWCGTSRYNTVLVQAVRRGDFWLSWMCLQCLLGEGSDAPA
jgi:hypothetical protein